VKALPCRIIRNLLDSDGKPCTSQQITEALNAAGQRNHRQSMAALGDMIGEE
jgi:hypothetical protein